MKAINILLAFLFASSCWASCDLSSLQPLDAYGGYPSVVQDGSGRLVFITNVSPDRVIARNLDGGPESVLFTTAIVTDGSGEGITRPQVDRIPGVGYVAVFSLYGPGQDYAARRYLEPALAISQDLQHWKYLGRFWRGGESDGGSMIRQPDGSWRAYLGDGDMLRVLSSETLSGPWNPLAETPGFGIFTHCRQVQDEMRCWSTEPWTAQSAPRVVYEWVSLDGLEFVLKRTTPMQAYVKGPRTILLGTDLFIGIPEWNGYDWRIWGAKCT